MEAGVLRSISIGGAEWPEPGRRRVDWGAQEFQPPLRAACSFISLHFWFLWKTGIGLTVNLAAKEAECLWLDFRPGSLSRNQSVPLTLQLPGRLPFARALLFPGPAAESSRVFLAATTPGLVFLRRPARAFRKPCSSSTGALSALLLYFRNHVANLYWFSPQQLRFLVFFHNIPTDSIIVRPNPSRQPAPRDSGLTARYPLYYSDPQSRPPSWSKKRNTTTSLAYAGSGSLFDSVIELTRCDRSRQMPPSRS
jgi:hypothetical protein